MTVAPQKYSIAVKKRSHALCPFAFVLIAHFGQKCVTKCVSSVVRGTDKQGNYTGEGMRQIAINARR